MYSDVILGSSESIDTKHMVFHIHYIWFISPKVKIERTDQKGLSPQRVNVVVRFERRKCYFT